MVRTRRLYAAISLVCALLVASLADPRWFGPSGPAAVAGLSAWLHLVGYAALAAVIRPLLGPGRRGTVAAVIAAAGYGAGMELLQFGVAYRTLSLADLAVNGVGAAVGVTARLGWHRYGRSVAGPTEPADDS